MKSLLTLFLAAAALLPAAAQQRLLPIDKSRSLEAELACQPVAEQQALPISHVRHEGLGHAHAIADGTQLLMSMPLSTGRRAQGQPGDPDYAQYGTCNARLDLHGQNLEHWNRLSFDIRTDLDAGVANMNVMLESHPWSSLGAHLVNMQGNEWQHVVYQIDELPRQQVYALRFYTDLKGRNLSQHDSIHYYIKELRLERVECPEPVHGWQTAPGHIAYSMSGYLPQGEKRAIVGSTASSAPAPFRLVDASTGATAFEGQAREETTTLGRFLVLDFSSFQRAGTYRLCFDTLATEPFPISSEAFLPSEEKLLSYIYGQRCGAEVEGIHGRCHIDVFADHNGRSYTYGGGWHDAGDLSQQTLQTGDVAYALLEAYEAHRDRHPVLAAALMAEARHGLDQVMRCRLGDGWHASSIGLLHWTDGQVGTADDIHSVRKQNLALDNFLYAAYEAQAALSQAPVPEASPADLYRRAAIEDFDYAARKLERDGVDTFRITMEHTYNTSDATFMAAASWSASMLYRLTGDRRYADLAARYIGYTLRCQETEGRFAGYFYRDTTRRAIVHYIHQSREQLPAQALVLLCQTQPRHRDFPRWHAAIERYASYLKQTMYVTRPYGMAPSGIYQRGEYADEDGFSRLHLWAPDNAHALYDQQLAEGEPIDADHALRRFPIWFSIFNGNEAILLSTGKAAALCGRYLGDDALLDIARSQLYWTVGQNPFCQSLIYGEGHRYPSMDSFSSGELTGEMPVGIRSWQNTDTPYWPMTNNACYKEVWLTSAGKWLSLLAELAPTSHIH